MTGDHPPLRIAWFTPSFQEQPLDAWSPGLTALARALAEHHELTVYALRRSGPRERFRIGYAPYGWDSLARHFRDVGSSVRAAEAVGLLVPRKSGPGHYDRFRHRLMFAIVDLDGKIVGFSGRTLDEPTQAELAVESGLDEKDALKRLARESGVSKSELYRELQRQRARRK